VKRAARIALLALAGPALAHGGPLRDPMQPPVPKSAAPRALPASSPAEPVVRHLLIIGEQRWVIDDGRRHGVGDMLAGARIERIEDSAVIVRRGGGPAQRLPLYPGITRRPVAAPATAGASTAGSTHIASSAAAGGSRSRRTTSTP
jgi:hypothetical protein